MITRINDFKNKQLPESLPFVCIDAYRCDVKEDETEKVKKSVIYTVIGIDFECRKQVLGYYQMFGDENISDWKVYLMI